MKKIFLDVGAWRGDTARVALDYDFDEIHAFEPVVANCKTMKDQIKDSRLIVHEVGLYHRNETKLVHCAGCVGASIFSGKRVVKEQRKKYPNACNCEFIKASTWFKQNLSEDDYVIAKINVEGAEVEIIRNLLTTGEYNKIHHMLIAFDIGKVKGKEHLGNELKDKLKELNFTNYVSLNDIKTMGKKNKGYRLLIRGILEYYFEMVGVKRR